ncbi:MAG: PfkB family carbohydrate kinase [Pseudomonadota bacterium]
MNNIVLQPQPLKQAPYQVERNSQSLKPKIQIEKIVGQGDPALYMSGQGTFEKVARIGLSTERESDIDYNLARRIHREMQEPNFDAGGNIPNILAIASMLGTPTVLYGVVGKDPWGEVFKQHAHNVGIDAKLTELPNKATRFIQFMVMPNGEAASGAMTGTTREIVDLPNNATKDSKFFITKASFLFHRDKNAHKVRKALVDAKANGAKTIIHLQNMQQGNKSDIVVPILESLMKENLIDMFIGSQNEMQSLFRLKDDDNGILVDRDVIKERIIHEAIKNGRHFVFTSDKNGATIVNKGKITRIPAENIDNPKDTTGAGDSFAGGYLSALSRGLDDDQAGEIASLVAAQCVQKRGSSPTQPSLKPIRKTMELLMKSKAQDIAFAKA